jgi:hypothetical protein
MYIHKYVYTYTYINQKENAKKCLEKDERIKQNKTKKVGLPSK